MRFDLNEALTKRYFAEALDYDPNDIFSFFTTDDLHIIIEWLITDKQDKVISDLDYEDLAYFFNKDITETDYYYDAQSWDEAGDYEEVGNQGFRRSNHRVGIELDERPEFKTKNEGTMLKSLLTPVDYLDSTDATYTDLANNKTYLFTDMVRQNPYDYIDNIKAVLEPRLSKCIKGTDPATKDIYELLWEALKEELGEMVAAGE